MTLLEEIQAKCSPELIASKDYAEIARVVSEGRKVYDGKTKYTSLGISENFPAITGLPGPLAAEMVFQKLEGFAEIGASSTDPMVKLLAGAVSRQMGHLKTGGMAIGSPAVKQMLEVLVSLSVITLTESQGLQDVALIPSLVTVEEVAAVLVEKNNLVGKKIIVKAPFDKSFAGQLEILDVIVKDGTDCYVITGGWELTPEFVEIL
jgi:hypothetical protein